MTISATPRRDRAGAPAPAARVEEPHPGSGPDNVQHPLPQGDVPRGDEAVALASHLVPDGLLIVSRLKGGHLSQVPIVFVARPNLGHAGAPFHRTESLVLGGCQCRPPPCRGSGRAQVTCQDRPLGKQPSARVFDRLGTRARKLATFNRSPVLR